MSVLPFILVKLMCTPQLPMCTCRYCHLHHFPKLESLTLFYTIPLKCFVNNIKLTFSFLLNLVNIAFPCQPLSNSEQDLEITTFFNLFL